MPIGMRYHVHYSHKRKEVVVFLQVGAQSPVEFVMGAEAFIQDLEYIGKDKSLAKLIEHIRQRKDLPIDHDFGTGGADFDTRQWDNMMEGQDGKDK